MERILINENVFHSGSAIDQAANSARVINARLAPALQAIGFELCAETLKDCLSGANVTRKAYFSAVEADIKTTRTPSIRKHMQDAADEAFEAFERELLQVRNEARNYKFLIVEGGKCVLTPDNEEKIKELSRIYVTEKKEVEAFKTHSQIVELLNQLFGGRIPYRWSSIFLEKENAIIRNDETDYSKLI
ncbi:MAG: hypothetical protein WCK18_15820 [Prolixibacteraceae bacterium]